MPQLKITLPLAASICALSLGLALQPLNPALAQDPKPTGEKPAAAKPAASEPETPSFDSYEAIVDHFEPERAEIAQEYEQASRTGRMTPEDVDALTQRLKAVDQRFVAAVRAYVKQAEAGIDRPSDLLPARRELVMFSSRFGEWEQTLSDADAYLAAFEKSDADSTREVKWLRADALAQSFGREEEAQVALEAVIKDYPKTIEGGMARTALYRTLLYLDRPDAARRLAEQALELEEVKRDPYGPAFFNTLLDNLEKIGTSFPELRLKDAEGEDASRANVLGGAALIWYWDTTRSACLDELPIIKEVAKAWDGKLSVFTVSVNGSQEAWRDYISQEPEGTGLTHYFEGNIEGEGESRLSSTKLGFNMIPLAMLIKADGKIHRFDVPSNELERTIRHWIGDPNEPEAEDDAASDAESGAPNSEGESKPSSAKPADATK